MLALWAIWGCDSPAAKPGPPAAGIPFTDVTAAAGIEFRHEAGARGEMLNPETFGPGAGWLDQNGDGLLDVLLVNGNNLTGPLEPASHPVFYQGLPGGRFRDATREVGLEQPLRGMGFVAADADNDGDQDLLIYGLGRSLFYIGSGSRFEERTAAAGLEGLTGWVAAAAFTDLDLDGWLDLFVGNYVVWDPAVDRAADCTLGTGRRNYCPVALFGPSSPQLFLARGDGTFADASAGAGFDHLRAKTLGVIVEDYDRDGLPDVFCANDTVPNLLLRNLGKGKFEEKGIETGFAVGADGSAFAGMGIDSLWLPSGQLAVAIGNFSGEPTTFHVQEGREAFLERSMTAGLGKATLDRVTFGVALEDLNLDGVLDLVLVNGHVFDAPRATGVPYRQKPQIFLGRRGAGIEGFFTPALPDRPGGFLDLPLVGRSLAPADMDRDGDIDLLVTENQGRVYLWRNDLPSPHHYIQVDLRGTRSNRDGLGAEVTLHLEGGSGGPDRLRRTRRAAGSYASQADRAITFGLPPGVASCNLEVRWPSGLNELFPAQPTGRRCLLVEGSGSPVESSDAPLPAAQQVGAPDSVAARARGLASLDAGRHGEAAQLLAAAVRADEDDLTARRALILALSRAGRQREAEAEARRTAARFRDPHLLVAQFGVVLRHAGAAAASEVFFREALALDPNRYDAWIAIANFAFDRRELDPAEAAYQKALQVEPRSVEALTNLGNVALLRKDYSGAKEWLERALQVQADSAAALGALGGIRLAEGDLPGAEDLLKRALATARSTETLVTIHGNLGILQARSGRRAEAIRSFEKVLELSPGDARARGALEKLR